jgi:hypothetical protein
MAKVRVKTMQESYKNKGILALFATLLLPTNFVVHEAH